MTIVNIQDAKARLSELVRLALQGEEVVIARHNKPVIRLQVIAEARTRRRLGTWAGQIHLAEDFDAPLEDFEDYT